MNLKTTCLLLCLIPLIGFSQSPEKLEARVDEIFQEWNHKDGPGCSVGIIQDGKLLFTKGYGLADLEHQVPNDAQTVFYVGSVSKHFVAASALLLIKEGKISEEDDIRKYFPELPDYGETIQVQHLIHHTSGIRSYLELGGMGGVDWFDHHSKEEILELICRQKELNFPPGSEYSYNNSGYFLLAELVSRVSDMSFHEYTQTHLFEPLGMNHSRFHENVFGIIPNRAWSYADDGEGNYLFNLSRFVAVGSGGLYTSVEDLLHWDQNFYENRLGDGFNDFAEYMSKEGKLNDGSSAGYAFGLNNDSYKGHRMVVHGGAFAGYRSVLMRFPDDQLSFIVLSNIPFGVYGKALEMADLFWPEEEAAEESTEETSAESVSLTEEDLKPFEGSYKIEEAGLVADIEILEGNLQVTQRWNGVSYPIVATSESEFIIEGNDNVGFEFLNVQDGQAQELKVRQGATIMTAKRTKALPESIDYAAYAGSYYSAELQASYKIHASEVGLECTDARGEKYELNYADTDQFVGAAGSVNFIRKQDQNQISGFRLDGGRVKGVYFEKK